MRSWRCILFLVILHLKQIPSDGDLPMGAKTVDKCPEPMNRTAWEMASKRLGCVHSGKIPSEQDQVYHCLPSSLLNAYVELCGITAPIDQGNCPVLHFVNTTGRNRSPSSWNCSTFSSGCPQEFYYSRDVYRYPECLSINRSRRCFRADISCIIDLYSTSTIGYNNTVKNKTAEQNRDTFDVVHWLFIFSVIVNCVLVIIILILSWLFKGRKDKKKTNFKGEGYQAAHLVLKDLDEKRQEEGEGEGCQAAPLLLKDLEQKYQGGEEISSSSDTDMSFKKKTSFNEISVSPVARLLCRIAEALPSEKLAKLKFHFKANCGEISREENDEISALDRYDFFQYMHRFYDFNLNVYILMGYLEEINEKKLLKICEKFAKSADHPLNYYTRNRRDRREYTKVYLKLAMDLEASNLQHIVNIVKNIQKLLHCKKEDIFVQGISKGCILLHLDVRSTLLETLRKCDFTCMRRHKVFKISIMEECIFYCPNLDDNFHKKEDPAGNFKVRMFYWFGILMRTFMEICKICWRGKQSRIRREMCNNELLTKTIIKESKNSEPLESSKECLEDELTGKPSTESELRFGEDPEQPTMLYRRMDESKSMPKEIPEFSGKIMDIELEKNQGEINKKSIIKKKSEEKLCLKHETEMEGTLNMKGKAELQEELDVKDETDMQLDYLHRRSYFRVPDRQGELDVQDKTTMNGELHDLNCSSDYWTVCSYECLQKDLVEVFSSIQRLVDLPAFDCYIRQDLHKMYDIKNHLEWRKHDLMKTDRAIVVAGETSSGKSSIINLIIGEDIVPTDIMATTTRVCRIRYSDKMQISTLDKDYKELERSKFNDEEELIEMMENLATTYDPQIECIDVWFPVTTLKGNMIIVDTPGKGDTEQGYVAKKMMEYLPHAVAVIFVVNVASGGGFQDDRFLNIIERVRESRNQLYYFNPEDAIFLLNKWDAVSQKRKRKNDMYEELKNKVHEIWEEVKDTNILKFAAAKVHEEEAYKVEFENFHEILKEVIIKNESKIVKTHLGFIKSFINDCDRSISSKLRCAKQSTEGEIEELDQLCRDLEVIKNKRQEAYSSLQESVGLFLEESTEDLYQYIHSSEFRSIVLDGIEKYTRFTIGRELEARIEKATLSWQQENIGELFERKILQNLTDSFVRIHESLHKIKSKMKGVTSSFDVEDKLGPVLTLIATSGPAVAGSMAMMYMSVSPKAASALAAAGVVTGLVCTGLVALDVLDDFETVTKNAYKARINKITKEKIRHMLHRTYVECFRNVIRNYLEGELKKEIEDLSESVNSTKSKIALYKTEESSLLGLYSEISKIQNRLEELKNIEIKLD